ncbi:MAG: Calx-beta domain-containing protein [Limisphaerales bacterium]
MHRQVPRHFLAFLLVLILAGLFLGPSLRRLRPALRLGTAGAPRSSMEPGTPADRPEGRARSATGLGNSTTTNLPTTRPGGMGSGRTFDAGAVADAAGKDSERGRDSSPWDAFDRWAEAWRRSQASVAGGGDAVVLEEGVRLARERRERMREMIRTNPKAALAAAAALSWSRRQALPGAVRTELEEWISATGDLEVLCAWRMPGRAGSGSGSGSGYQRTFTTVDRVFHAFVYGRRLAQTTAHGISVHGVAVDDVIAIAEFPLRALGPEEAEDARRAGRLPAGAEACAVTGAPATLWVDHGGTLLALADASVVESLGRSLMSVEPGFRENQDPPEFRQWSHGVKRLLFMRARFPDDVREPISEADASDVMRLANEYFAAASFNNLGIISTIGPLVMLPQPKLYYSVRGPGALLADARTATRDAGIEPDVYDLDMVRFENVPGFDWGGLGSVGGKGVWLQGSGLGVICHELGHNLGLSHANFWNTVRPEPPTDPGNLPFDADSLVGLDSVIGPGDDVEYGDPFDIMGGGGGASAHYNGLHKVLLGWLPEASVLTVTTSGVYRVHVHDSGALAAGATHVIRVRKDVERMYWIDARGAIPDNPWLSRGVELHWNNWHQAIGSTELLDTTPGTGHGRTDAALTLGRTFSDEAAGIHVTPLQRGVSNMGGVAVPYYDVAVHLGSSDGNARPELELAASATEVGLNEPVQWTATATDADGDGLSFAWDLGDGIPGENRPEISTAWSVPGDYVVRCEVSDGRGGRAARHGVVRVGRVTSLRIRGRVLDQAGEPLLGVRVHNGRAGTNSPYAPEYRWAITDSDGGYTMVGMAPGSYEVGAVLGGYDVRPLNFSRPLVLSQFTGVDVDFIAAALPRVSVAKMADGEESSGRPARFEVSRAGPTNETLRVYFRVSGSAAPGEDYTPWDSVEVQTNIIPTVLDPVVQELEMSFVDLGPGLLSTQVDFPVANDSLSETDETLVVTLTYPVTRTIETETETNTFDIPGWQVRADNGRDAWFQTRPFYQLGARDEATAVILDGNPVSTTSLSIVAVESVASENRGDSATFLVRRTGRRPEGSLVIPLEVSGTAVAGEDYAALSGAIRMPADVEALRVTVEVLDDLFVEGNETVTVALGDGPGYSVGRRSATISIVDNDLAWVAVSAQDPVIAEGGAGAPGTGGSGNPARTRARVTFQRFGDLGTALEVDYLVGGTAVAGMDYEALPGRVVIPAGAGSATVEVAPINDSELEGDETVEIRVGDSPVYNVVRPGWAVVTVRDDEFPTVTVEAVDAEAVEGNDDVGTWVLRRTGSTAQPLEVRYRFGGSAQHQVDFIAIGDRIVIPAGQSQVTLTATPIDDPFREDPETIAIELLEAPEYSLGVPVRAGVNLLDNDDSELAAGFALLATRGLESKTDPELVVRISGNPDEGPENAVTVAWEVLGGTATLDADYVLTNGTLTFEYADPEGDEPWGNRVATIPLQIVDDSLVERDETFLIRLRIAPTEIASEDPETPPTLVTNGVLDVYTVHTYTIIDDDASVVSVGAEVPGTIEGGVSPAVFAIRRTGRTNAAQTVTLDLSGLATPGNDYLDVPRSVTLVPGQDRVDVVITPVDDPLEEYRENVRLTLVSAPGSRLASTPFADVQIEDNDGTIEFTSARREVSEGDGEVRVAVRRAGNTNLAATVRYEVRAEGGTATPVGSGDAADYWPAEGVLEFAPGERLKDFGVALVDDLEIEGPETVLLTLSRGSGLFPLGGQNVSTLTILDNDALVSAGTNGTAEIEAEPALVVTLVRTGPTGQPLVVMYRTEDRTAAAGEDYEATSGTVVFGAGAETVDVTIPFRDDPVIEGDETFSLLLESVEGDPLGTVVLAIVDDDCSVVFSRADHDVNEDDGVVDITVTRLGSPLNPILVDFRSVSGTAVENVDFARTSGVLEFLGNRLETLTNGTGEVVFRRGETNRVISVPILNDSEGERDEVFQLELTAARPGPGTGIEPFVTLGGLTNTQVTIRDNEAPGRLDESFQPGLGADGPVRALALQGDGKVLVGGDFATFDGVVQPRLVRLHADGFVDQSFNTGLGFDGSVLAVGEIGDGRLLVGGTFSRVDGSIRTNLARLEPDGTRSLTGQWAVDGPVRAIATGDRVFIGGAFGRVESAARYGVARMALDGGLDPEFQPIGSGRPDVRALADAGDAGAWVGGGFSDWAGTGQRYLVRLRPDGSPDAALPSGFAPNGAVNALARGSDGSIYLGGEFTAVGGLPRAGVARWLASGGVDPGFDPGTAADGFVLATAADSAGRSLFAGSFEAFAGGPAGRFVRLDSEGGMDPGFFQGPGANDVVRALVVQPNGAILLGGDFTEVNERPRLRVARIHAEEKFTDGFVEFTEPVLTVLETERELEISVRRTGSARNAARVEYRTSDITARAGVDYDAASGQLAFEPGQTVATFRLGARDDAIAEGNESLGLELGNPEGFELGRHATAVVVIADDEAAVGWELSEVEASEDAGSVQLTIRRSGSLEAEARVRVDSRSLGAVDGEDYRGVSGEAFFAPGIAVVSQTVTILDDERVEGPEDFEVVLSEAAGGTGVGLGSQSVVRVVIVDDDRVPTHYTLTVQPGPGGIVFPGGGRYPTNSMVTLNAIPDRGFEFARWEGTVASSDNPLELLLDRNHVVSARFRAREYLETFETGDFSRLPWMVEGDLPWQVARDSASSGEWSARSGSVTNSGLSVLRLDRETPAGGGSFDLRTETEAGWDFLEFWVNGERRERWSGVNGWQTHLFNLPAGLNRLEWRYSRDRTFGGTRDAVWIDNLDLPDRVEPSEPPRLRWLGGGSGGCQVGITGAPGRLHVLEASEDLRQWRPVAAGMGELPELILTDPDCGTGRTGHRYYRVRVD